MRIINDELWFCACCALAHANADTCECLGHSVRIVAGFARLTAGGATIAMNDQGEEREFSSVRCDCCRSPIAGARYRFALFAPE